MIVSFMGIAFGDSESKEGERKELETVFEGGAVCNFRKKSVLLSGFLVCWGLECS